MPRPVTDPDILAQLEGGGGGRRVTDPGLLALLEESDPIRQKVRGEYARDIAAGVPAGAGYARRILQGATFNFADEALAALQTPFEMAKRGTWSPVEGYKHAKAREDIELEEARRNQGWLGTAAEMAGGVGSGMGLVRGGATLLPSGVTSLPTRIAAGVGEAALYGATSGAGEGNTLAERGYNAATGAAFGGAVGGGLPVAGAIARPIIGPGSSLVRALINPRGVAQSQAGRALQESGRSAQGVVDDVALAAREGQGGAYTVADAMGNAGQRALSTVTRAPGQGRTNAAEFLEARQAGQGRRVSNLLAEGFEAPQTAAQTQTALTAQRAADAGTNYGAARQAAGAVNLSPVLQMIDDTLSPGASGRLRPQTQIADDTIEGVLRRVRGSLSDGNSQVMDFNTAFRAKLDLDDLIGRAPARQQQALIPVRDALDETLAQASAPYAQARDAYRAQSQVIGAVEQGTEAAKRGRVEDTVPNFRAMTPDQQKAFRSGYVDPLIAQTQGAAVGANKARPLTSEAFQVEGPTFAAPGQADQMMRRAGRENTMFETRAHALGGSRTADNLADQDAMRIDPSILSNVAMGNFGTAAGNMLSRAAGALSGNTPAVRQELVKLLLQRGPNAQSLQPILDKAVRRSDKQRELARLLLHGAYGGGADALSIFQASRSKK